MTYQQALRYLRRKAKPYYVEHGRESWEHVNQVLRNAEAMTKKVYGRPLTLSEKAAILFHDAAIKSTGSHKNHGQHGRDIAIPILLSTGVFDKQQIEDIGQAIVEHDILDDKGGPFSSTTGEVLASGDADPPDLPWFMNKMYCWRIQNIPDKSKWKQDIYDTAISDYGVDSTIKYPDLYNKYYGDKPKQVREAISKATPDELWDIALKYRKKHRIKDDEVRFPPPPL